MKHSTLTFLSPVNLGVTLIAFGLNTASADFSLLDANQKGLGLLTSPLGARERAMGGAGIATQPPVGVSIANPSRMAFQEKTSFSATFEGTFNYLRDDDISNRRSDAFLPSLSFTFPTRSYGALGLWYFQDTHRNAAYDPASNEYGVLESHRAEGGIFDFAVAYSYSPIRSLALGIDWQILSGRDRFITEISAVDGSVADSLTADSRALEDTVVRKYEGSRPGFSLTFRIPAFSAGIHLQPGTDLKMKTDRAITGISNGLHSSEKFYLPWMGQLGLAYKPSNRHTFAFDLGFNDWDKAQGGGLNQGYLVATGYEFIDRGGVYDAYWRKMAWRGGFGIERIYLESTTDVYASLGLGLPLGPRGHWLDVALKGGQRELGGNSFLAEDYLKLTVTVQGVGNWGQPARRHR